MSVQQSSPTEVEHPEAENPCTERVVVVGSGFAGFFAARRLARLLRRSAAEVVLVSDSAGMLYSPLLPDVAAGTVDGRAITVPTTGVPGVRVLRGHVDEVDLDGHRLRHVGVDGREHTLEWSRLLLAPGSVTRLLDIPGLAEHAVGFKTVGEALHLRDRLITQLEAADASGDPEHRRAALTFLVVGAGYAGTELCAQLALLTRRLVPRYPGVDPDDVHWLLVDVAEQVMPELGEELGDDALALLGERGVDVRLGTSVERVDADEVPLADGTVLGCQTVVWCAGVTASPLIGDLGLPTAQHALRQAHAAARNIAASLGHGTARPYRHHDLGLVVDLGGPDAAAAPLGLRLRGLLAKLVARGYHLYALPSGRRRARVVADWVLAVGAEPDSVAFGLVPREAALVTAAEHDRLRAGPG